MRPRSSSPSVQVYCVYYEDGKGSSLRVMRLRVDTNGAEAVQK